MTSSPWLERLIWLGLGAVLAGGGFFLLRPGRPAEAVEAPAAGAAAPDSHGDAPRTVPESPREPDCYLGVVLAREAVDVASEMEGLLKEVRVRTGDRVEKDQLLARLDTEMLRQQLELERARLKSAEAQIDRYKIEVSESAHQHERRLALEGLLSKEEEEASRFASEKAEAELASARAEAAQVEASIRQHETTLARAEIRAPFVGTVAQRYLDPGARVSPGMPVVRLISSGSLLARFAVPPEETSRVPTATEVRVEVEDLGLTLAGVVEHLAPEIDAASQMVFAEARLELPDVAPDIPSGTVARVSVAADGALASCLSAPAGH